MLARESRDVLTAWTIGTAAIIALALALTGCERVAPTAVSADTFTAIEMALVDHTARFADQIGVRVRGVVTDRLDSRFIGDGQNVVAWYEAGTAYYYRPRVALYVALVPTPGRETASNIAAHEVAHARYRNHDCAHWRLSDEIADPTYPEPGVCR